MTVKPRRSPTAALLICSASLFVASCGDKVNSPASIPATLFQKQEKPKVPAEAYDSAKAAEAWREDVAAWGARGWAALDQACLWLRDAGYQVECR